MLNKQIGSKRLDWIDFGKGISMFMVILSHSETTYPQSDFYLCPFFQYFRMPLFFVLSGYLFTSNYKEFSLKRKLKQILRGIAWTYLIFTLIIWVPKAIVNGTGVVHDLYDILLGRASWFVVAIGLAQLMLAVMLHYTKNLKVIGGGYINLIIIRLCYQVCGYRKVAV